MSTSTGSARFKWPYVGVGLLALWIGFRTWDYYGRPLTEADLKTASPDRLAQGLSNPAMRDLVAAKLLDGGPSGWKALVRALRFPNRDARLVSALTLAKLRVLSLEAGIANSLPESDPEVYAAKVAALASNGSRKSISDFAQFLSHTNVRESNPTYDLAFRRLEALLPSINTSDSLADLAPLFERSSRPSAVMAASEFDTEPLRRAIGSLRSKVPFRERVMLACRFPGESDPFVAAAASAAIGNTNALADMTMDHLERLAQMVDMADYPSNSSARPFLLAALTLADYPKAVNASVEDPDEGSIEQLKRFSDSASFVAKDRIAIVRRLNGDASAALTIIPRNINHIIAARRTKDVSIVPMLRDLIKDPNTSTDEREAALGALAELSLDQADRVSIMQSIAQMGQKWTKSRVDVALALSDGWRLLYRAVETTDPNSPDGQNLIATICSFPSPRVNPGLQNEVVRACSKLDWEHIGVLDPAWCKTYGDDVLKEKYALLLGNNLYDGRIKALRLFAASGHKLIGEELVKTAGRGLIDETVACLEAVGENGLEDQTPFVLGYAKDNRWRVREAAAYALRLLPLNIESDEAITKLAHDPNKAVVRTAIDPMPDLSHRAVSGREVPPEVALKFRGSGSSLRANLRLWRSWGTRKLGY